MGHYLKGKGTVGWSELSADVPVVLFYQVVELWRSCRIYVMIEYSVQ